MLRSEKEVQDLLAKHENDMAACQKRLAAAETGRHEDREEARNAQFDYHESKIAQQLLRWYLSEPTERNYKHLFDLE